MQNKTPVRVVFLVNEPFSFACMDKVLVNGDLCPKPGADVEFVMTLLHGLLHLKLQIIPVVGFSAIMEYIQNGSADFIGTAVLKQPFSSLEKHGLFSSPVAWINDVAIFGKEIVIKERGNAGWSVDPKDIMGFLTIFSWKIWLMTLGITGLVYFIKYCTKKQSHHQKPSMPEAITKCFRILWFLAVGVVLSLFSSLMAVDLVQPEPKRALQFKNLNDLTQKIGSGYCTLGMQEPQADNVVRFLADQENENPLRFFVDLKESLDKNPPVKVANIDAMVKLIMRSDAEHCYVGLDSKIARSYYERANCQLKMLQTTSSLIPVLAVYYHKLPWLNEPLTSLMATESVQSLSYFIQRKYFTPPDHECSMIGNGNINFAPLSLQKVFSSFVVVLLSGYIVTFCCLILEKLHASHGMGSQEHKSHQRQAVMNEIDSCMQILKEASRQAENYDEMCETLTEASIHLEKAIDTVTYL